MTALLVLALSLLLLMTPLGGMRTSAQRTALQGTGLQVNAPAAAQLKKQQPPAPKVEALGVQGNVRRAQTGSAMYSAQQAATALDSAGTANAIAREFEPNNTVANAQPISGTGVRVRADLYQFPIAGGDVDIYSFFGNAGDRVYAATQTFFSAGSGDTVIDIIAPDGTTVLETDDEDGAIGGSASNIGGTTLLATGTHYVRVRPFTLTLAGTIRPYDLYFRVQSGAPVAEVELNDVGTPNPLPPSGWVSGTIATAADSDTFSFTANAGDTIVAILDADPERNAPEWNPILGIGLFNNFYLVVEGSTVGGALDDANPSEAFFMTVKDTGTYEVLVAESANGGAANFTYHLSVSVIPGNKRRCTTYAAGAGGAINDATINNFPLTVAGNEVINNLQVAFSATHTDLTDLDVSLVGPQGNEVVLFDDVPVSAAGAAAPQFNLVLDDEAAVPIGAFGLDSGMHYSPESFSRLNWFKGQQSNGTWTLRIRDDAAGDTGTLHSWSLNICEEPSVRRPLVSETDVFLADFESGTNGFTHSGTQDEWARGTPSGGSAPIIGCFAGLNCWKTDLTGTYNSSSNQDLLSPSINLTTIAGRNITLSWWQKYQIGTASSDTAFVEIREVGNPSNFRKLWEWKAADMIRSVGTPAVTVQESAGWGLMEYDISEFGGKNIEVRFHLESDAAATNRSGIAIDDFNVSYDATAARADFDNDAKSDVSVWRQDTGNWFIRNSSTAVITVINDWGRGALGDIAVPGNYGGTKLTDIAVWREPEGNWYILPDPTIPGAPFLVGWGINNDVPVQGDYNGDTLTDYAVWRPSDGNWYVKLNGGGSTVRNWGLSSDVPVPADYDGDGKTDIAVFRPSEGNWYIIDSFTGFGRVVSFGQSGDKLVPADYDGDRKADIAVWRPSEGNWYIRRSSDNRQTVRNWGLSTDIPVPGKYDADAKYDIAVWRPSEGNWYIIRSSDNAGALFNLGLGTDVPVPSAYLPQP
jgi:subtilisin-like proprotein convertase family protein